MVEFAVVLVMKNKTDRIKTSSKIADCNIRIYPSPEQNTSHMAPHVRDEVAEDVPQNKGRPRIKVWRQKLNAENIEFLYFFGLFREIDIAALFLFVVGFSVFNCIYEP